MAQIKPFCGGYLHENTYNKQRNANFDAFIATICSQQNISAQCEDTGVCAYHTGAKSRRCQPKLDAFQLPRVGVARPPEEPEADDEAADTTQLDVWFDSMDAAAQQLVADGEIPQCTRDVVSRDTQRTMCRRAIQCKCPMQRMTRTNDLFGIVSNTLYEVDYPAATEQRAHVAENNEQNYDDLIAQIRLKNDSEAFRLCRAAVAGARQHAENPDDAVHRADYDTHMDVLEYYRKQLRVPAKYSLNKESVTITLLQMDGTGNCGSYAIDNYNAILTKKKTNRSQSSKSSKQCAATHEEGTHPDRIRETLKQNATGAKDILAKLDDEQPVVLLYKSGPEQTDLHYAAVIKHGAKVIVYNGITDGPTSANTSDFQNLDYTIDQFSNLLNPCKDKYNTPIPMAFWK